MTDPTHGKRRTLVVGPVIGHRGASGHAPENTEAALRAAARLGLRWVEFDVRLSRDEKPILFHDDRLDRTTGAKGRVRDRDFEDLMHIDAGSWFGPAFAGEPILGLERALQVLADLGLGANVEIKPDAERRAATGAVVAAMLADHWPRTLPPPLVSSFSMEALVAVRSVAPQVRCAALFGSVPSDWRARLAGLGSRDLHCAVEGASERLIRSVRNAGVAVRCYTVNDASTAERLFDWGVEAVFTDFPDRVSG